MYDKEDYDSKVVGRSQDKLIAKKRQFFTLVDPSADNSRLAQELAVIQENYKDDMDVWVYDNTEETLMYTYECYHPPCSHYIEVLEGRSYAFIST